MNKTRSSSLPLEGVRVLDFTSMVSGPYCTRLLADMGATVTKIESRAGDLLRYAAPQSESGSRYFQIFNAGKQSLTLDLKSSEGLAIAAELAENSDIIVENFRPGVLAGLGLGYDKLCTTNPSLIYCSISGFGQTGSMKDWPAYAPIVHALSGFDSVFMQTQEAMDEPPIASIQIADVVTGAFAFGAIQTALVKQLRTGEGEYIDSTLIESAMTLISSDFQVPQVPIKQKITTYKAVQTSNGHVMPVIISDKAFQNLARIIKPTWLEDPELQNIPGRAARSEEIHTEIENWTKSHTSEECQNTFMAVGVPCASYPTPEQVLENQHLKDRGTFSNLNDGAGDFRINNAPFKFKNVDISIKTIAPTLGEHSATILASLPGYSSERIATLKQTKII